MKRYTSEKEILNLLEQFEGGTIAREDWGHPEHLVVALCFIARNDLKIAIEKMRNGIFNLLPSFGVDLTNDMPYHETLTIFWMTAVADFYDERRGAPIVDVVNDMVAKFDKDYPLRFYSRDVLFSDRARAEFVKGDL